MNPLQRAAAQARSVRPYVSGRHLMPTLLLLPPLLATQLAAQVPEWFRRPVVLPPDTTQVEIREGIDYKARPDLHIAMDLYRPKTSRLVPAVLLVQGGQTGDFPVGVEGRTAGKFRSLGRILAARGLVAITFTHRLTSANAIDTAAADIRDATAYVVSHAQALGVDPSRVCVWAISAGGSLIGPTVREFRDRIRCVVLYYTVLSPSLLQDFAGGGERVAQTTPSLGDLMSRDSLQLPATFIIRVGKDDPRLNAAIDAFVALAIHKGTELELHTYPDGRHAFDILDDTDTSRSLLLQTVAFLKGHLVGN